MRRKSCSSSNAPFVVGLCVSRVLIITVEWINRVLCGFPVPVQSQLRHWGKCPDNKVQRKARVRTRTVKLREISVCGWVTAPCYYWVPHKTSGPKGEQVRELLISKWIGLLLQLLLLLSESNCTEFIATLRVLIVSVDRVYLFMWLVLAGQNPSSLYSCCCCG